MREDDFNLIDQPWIRVRMADAQLEEMSLCEIFAQSHKIRALAGELPTQDVAILRLMLAILYTVFTRVDTEGEESPLEKEDDALDRWQELWEAKQFPDSPIQDYLTQVKDRFWLFDEKFPFYQSPEAKTIAGRNTKGELKCKASKMNGEINKSDNKERIFTGRNQKEKDSLSYAEAARWLVHMISYDDCAVKKSDSYKKREKSEHLKEEGSPGTGWLGKLGLVYAEGDNLFETLMLNLVFCPNGENEEYYEQNPVWEWESNAVQERKKVTCPNNMAELLTFPSRYVLLEREQGRVIGAYPVYGMYFDSAVPLEQMTMRWGVGKKADVSPYQPKLHPEGAFLWQEFESLFVASESIGDRRPGVVRWIQKLQAPENQMITPQKLVRFASVGIYYDSNKSSIQQIELDRLGLHAGLISEMGEEWRKHITGEIDFARKATALVETLAKELRIAESGNLEKDKTVLTAGEKGRNYFYEQLDIPFRKWLQSISVTDSDMEEKRSQWRNEVRNTAAQLGKDLVENAGPAAYTGRIVQGKDSKITQRYSAAKSYADFLRKIKYLK